MSKTCVYLLNQNPLYYAMFSLSLQTLRKSNPHLPITLFHILDLGADNYTYSNYILDVVKNVAKNSELKQFVSFDWSSICELCKKYDVSIKECPRPFNYFDNYTPTHRTYLQNIKEESVFLLDADTFIFGNLDNILKKKSDFVADYMKSYRPTDKTAEKTTWVFNYEKNQDQKKVSKVRMDLFNSGVVLFNNFNAQKYGEQVQRYCNRLLLKKHPMAEVMYAHRPDGRNREECACTLFVLENNLEYEYFTKEEVQTYDKESRLPLIVHTTTPKWTSTLDSTWSEIRALL